MAEMNRGDIRSKVKTLVGETGTNFFSDTQYNRFIDDSYLRVCTLFPAQEKELILDWSAVSNFINTSEDRAEILHVDWDNRPLEPVTLLWLENQDEKWETRFGEPTHYFIEGREYGQQNILQTFANKPIGLYPRFPTAMTGIVRIIVKMNGVRFTGDSDLPLYPSFSHDAVVYEAARMVLSTQGEHRNPELAAAYLTLRDHYIERARVRMSNRHPRKINVVATTTRPRGTLIRDRHVPASGKAPGF